MQINNVLPIHLTFIMPDKTKREGNFPPSLRLYDVMRELKITDGTVLYDAELNLGLLGLKNGDEIQVF